MNHRLFRRKISSLPWLFLLLWPAAVAYTFRSVLWVWLAIRLGFIQALVTGVALIVPSAVGIALLYANRRLIAASRLLMIYAVISPILILSNFVRFDRRAADETERQMTIAPRQIEQSEWQSWGLRPTFRDGVLVELRRLDENSKPVYPVWLMPRMTELEVLEYGPGHEPGLMRFLPNMRRLQRCTLRRIDFSPGTFQPDAFQTLAELTSLQSLAILAGQNIDEAAIAHLAGSTSLVELDLSETRRPVRFGRLAQGGKRLETLRLNATLIDDEEFLQLVDLPALKRIDVSNTHVTFRGAIEFLERRPDVYVEIDVAPPPVPQPTKPRGPEILPLPMFGREQGFR